MRLALFFIFAVALNGQAILPPVNSLSAGTITCAFGVIDNQTTVEVDCGPETPTQLFAPLETGDVIGRGPIRCLLWRKAGDVRLQCSIESQPGYFLIALDGILKPIARKRTWK